MICIYQTRRLKEIRLYTDEQGNVYMSDPSIKELINIDLKHAEVILSQYEITDEDFICENLYEEIMLANGEL